MIFKYLVSAMFYQQTNKGMKNKGREIPKRFNGKHQEIQT
jgi:hypothetical protein